MDASLNSGAWHGLSSCALQLRKLGRFTAFCRWRCSRERDGDKANTEISNSGHQPTS